MHRKRALSIGIGLGVCLVVVVWAIVVGAALPSRLREMPLPTALQGATIGMPLKEFIEANPGLAWQPYLGFIKDMPPGELAVWAGFRFGMHFQETFPEEEAPLTLAVVSGCYELSCVKAGLAGALDLWGRSYQLVGQTLYTATRNDISVPGMVWRAKNADILFTYVPEPLFERIIQEEAHVERPTPAFFISIQAPGSNLVQIASPPRSVREMHQRQLAALEGYQGPRFR